MSEIKARRIDMAKQNYAEQNNVAAENQLNVNEYVRIIHRGGSKKVLFFGNSITRHAPKADIGWHGDWGMAASCPEKDYVHRVVAFLDKKYGTVDYCIAQGSAWERGFFRGEEILEEYYSSARDFAADIVIVRIGENIRRDERADCKPYFDMAIKYLAKDPEAKVILTDNFWSDDTIHEYTKSIAEENDYVFCSIGDLSEDEGNMAIGLFEHRGVSIHPGDLGMERIAERIIDCLK